MVIILILKLATKVVIFIIILKSSMRIGLVFPASLILKRLKNFIRKKHIKLWIISLGILAAM